MVFIQILYIFNKNVIKGTNSKISYPFLSLLIICRLQNRIQTRLQELEHMPAQMSVHLRTRALIELKSLKLMQFQKQLRHEILNTMKVSIERII